MLPASIVFRIIFLIIAAWFHGFRYAGTNAKAAGLITTLFGTYIELGIIATVIFAIWIGLPPGLTFGQQLAGIVEGLMWPFVKVWNFIKARAQNVQ